MTEERLLQAADAELELAQPLRDNAYKLPLARNLITRTLLELAELQ
jgi:xanthine dehydrogenase YagS FAD-binding subunit